MGGRDLVPSSFEEKRALFVWSQPEAVSFRFVSGGLTHPVLYSLGHLDVSRYVGRVFLEVQKKNVRNRVPTAFRFTAR